MVIACSKCQTRFHVEDERVPEAGVRVRCSKCKHAFFVRPPSAPADAGLHAAAEAAATSGVAAAPEPSLDLDGTTEPPGAAESAPSELGAPDDEDDWQFAIDPPSAAAERSAPAAESADLPTPSLSARAEERREPSFEEPETSSLSDLESPESWNLLGGNAEAESLAEDEAGLEEIPEAEFAEPLDHEAPLPREPREGSAGLRLVARALGWITLAALLGLLGRGLLGAASTAPVAAAPGPVSVAGLEARELRGRWIENALAGPLFVVDGTLANAASAPRVPGRAIRVVPLDADARPLPGAALAGQPLAPGEIRRGDPAELQAALESTAATFARRPLAAGEAVPFQVVLEGVDPAAVAFRLEGVEPPPVPEAAPDAATAAGPAAEAS